MNNLNLVELRKILIGQLDEFTERIKNGEEVMLIPSIISMDYSGGINRFNKCRCRNYNQRLQ